MDAIIARDEMNVAPAPAVERPDASLRDRVGLLTVITGAVLGVLQLIKQVLELPVPWAGPYLLPTLIALFLLLTVWLWWERPRMITARRWIVSRTVKVAPLVPVLNLGALLLVLGTLGAATFLAREVTQIRRGCATEYVGVFPTNTRVINRSVGNTQSRLRILTDYAAFAAWSDPESHHRYRQLITELAGATEKADVEMIVYGKERAKASLEKQFETCKLDELLKSRSWKLFKRVHATVQDPRTMQEFLGLIAKYNEECEDFYSNSGVGVREIGEKSPVFVWIRDDEECVICFAPEEGLTAPEATFYSRDMKLVGQATAFYNMYRERSQPLAAAHAGAAVAGQVPAKGS